MWSYQTNLEWTPGTEEAVSHCEGKAAWPVAAPPEFGGRADRWSPEDALVGATESCLLLTILFFVGKLGVTMTGYRSRAKGVMERSPKGLRFTSIEIEIDAEVGSEADVPKMHQAVERAEAACPVAQALNIRPTVKLTARVVPA